jgi:hypothetical protein
VKNEPDWSISPAKVPGAVVHQQQRQWRTFVTGRLPHHDADLAHGQLVARPGGALGVEPARGLVARHREPGVRAEGTLDPVGVAGVGHQDAVDVEEVLQAVEVRQREPQLPAILDLGHPQLDAQVDVEPDLHVGVLVLGVAEPEDDLVVLDSRGELGDGPHPLNLGPRLNARIGR